MNPFQAVPFKALFPAFAAALALSAPGLLSSVLAEGLRAGVARIDITPSKPVTLAGYSSRTNLSQGVHDPLSARAVVFEQDGKKLVLVSLDILGFYNNTAPPLRQAILDANRLQPSELFLSAIHTHSAPTPILDPAKGHANNVEYTQKLQRKLVEVVRQALERMAPAQVSFGSGSAPVGANRREAVRDTNGNTRIILGRNPGVLTDCEVQVLKIARAEGNQLSGVLFAYATHSTSLGPRNYIVSGDVQGLAAQFIERYLGGDIVAPVFAGASGNIDPWFRIMPGFNTTNGWIPEPVLLGTFLGEEVVHVLSRTEKPLKVGAIRSAIKTIELPGKPRGQGAPTGDTSKTPMVITAACVGDIAFFGMGGEVFHEIGRAIKDASPFAHTMILTHCNGAAGYLPTRVSYPEGGYEVQSSAFAPGADEQLIEEASRLLRDLRAK